MYEYQKNNLKTIILDELQSLLLEISERKLQIKNKIDSKDEQEIENDE